MSKAPLGGGPAVVLAAGQKFSRANTPFGAGSGIAVDAACVYWTDGADDGHVSTVAK